ncbi:MAG: (2Fe-2S)-binding protein [Acidimicrobiia bacterium]
MALVCLCNGVSERKVVRAIAHGADTIDEIGRACRAGTTCHGCHDTLEALLEDRPVMVPRRHAIA